MTVIHFQWIDVRELYTGVLWWLPSQSGYNHRWFLQFSGFGTWHQMVMAQTACANKPTNWSSFERFTIPEWGGQTQSQNRQFWKIKELQVEYLSDSREYLQFSSIFTGSSLINQQFWGASKEKHPGPGSGPTTRQVSTAGISSGFPQPGGHPQNGWFLTGNPTKMDGFTIDNPSINGWELGVPPYFMTNASLWQETRGTKLPKRGWSTYAAKCYWIILVEHPAGAGDPHSDHEMDQGPNGFQIRASLDLVLSDVMWWFIWRYFLDS